MIKFGRQFQNGGVLASENDDSGTPLRSGERMVVATSTPGKNGLGDMLTTESMIERVARALCGSEGPFTQAEIEKARAVLAAVRETFENVQAGYDVASEHGDSAAAGVAASDLQDAIDLIDAALEGRR